MMDSFFSGMFDTDMTSVIGVNQFLICIGSSLLLGLIIAASYMYRTRYTKSFVITLALLPTIVCVVIMMVNGNIGAGVAVAGAFSLVRFRSVPGSAKEIGMIFLAMGAGLISGMGYLGFSLLFVIIMCLIFMLYNRLNLGEKKNFCLYKTINITIPEDLDYTDVFADLFDEYTASYELIRVKTINLGSMFRLSYNVILKKNINEKEFVDNLRCRNGNLEICVSNQETVVSEL